MSQSKAMWRRSQMMASNHAAGHLDNVNLLSYCFLATIYLAWSVTVMHIHCSGGWPSLVKDQ